MKFNWKFWKKKDEKKCTYNDHKTWYGKAWHFLAHEDSWASLLADAVIIFVLGKFVILPLFGLAMGTGFPLVAVVSSSMDHEGLDFDEWWEERGQWYDANGITKEQFKEFYKSDGFKKGDAFVVKGIPLNELRVGDIIVYTAGQKNPIIHRVIDIKSDYVVTKGDANAGLLSFERKVSEEQVQGNTVLWFPFIGWPKAIITSAIG